jgi:hypothetical protein
MRISAIAILMLTACSAGRVQDCERGVSANATPLCLVAATPNAYDGQEITITALFQNEPHDAVLFSNDCGIAVNLARTSDYEISGDRLLKSLLKHNRFRKLDVVLRGTFRIAKEEQCFGSGCRKYEFQERQLLCAALAP